MAELGGELDLAEEALGAQGSGNLRVNQLERNRALLPEVMRQIDRGHAAPAQLAIHPVTVCKRFLDAFTDHWVQTST